MIPIEAVRPRRSLAHHLAAQPPLAHRSDAQSCALDGSWSRILFTTAAVLRLTFARRSSFFERRRASHRRRSTPRSNPAALRPLSISQRLSLSSAETVAVRFRRFRAAFSGTSGTSSARARCTAPSPWRGRRRDRNPTATSHHSSTFPGRSLRGCLCFQEGGRALHLAHSLPERFRPERIHAVFPLEWPLFQHKTAPNAPHFDKTRVL